MGTNYYARSASCPHCGRRDPDVHILKNLVNIRCYPLDEWGGASPWGPIRSWRDWRDILRSHSLQVFDEYGTEHGLEDFIARVEATDMGYRRKQFDWMRDHYPSDDREWLDEDGFSCTSAEFS